MSLKYFTRFTYYHTKEFVEQRTNFRYRLKRHLEVSLILAMILRLLNFVLVAKFGIKGQMKYDPLMHYQFRNSETLDINPIIIGLVWCLSELSIQCPMYFIQTYTFR